MSNETSREKLARRILDRREVADEHLDRLHKVLSMLIWSVESMEFAEKKLDEIAVEHEKVFSHWRMQKD